MKAIPSSFKLEGYGGINKILQIIGLLIFCCCNNPQKSTETESNKLTPSQKDYIRGVIKNEIDTTHYIDESATAREMYSQLFFEVPDQVYEYINKNISPEACAEFKDNSMIVLMLEAKDTLIKVMNGESYSFSKNGEQLVFYDKSPKKLMSLFNQLDARKIDIIDNYKHEYYEFRIEVDKVCN
ncbi:MAG: hypothetical protein WD048_02630 [Chitinophagales bacterium]